MSKKLRIAVISAFAVLFVYANILHAAAYDSGAASGKSGDVTIVYFAVAILSVLLVVLYLLQGKNRNMRFLALYCFVAVANIGYYILSLAGSLEIALAANRISYFGCAYAVLMMLFIIMDVCKIRCSKYVAALLIGISTAAFLLAASGGWLDIYYSSVGIETVNGVTKLVKTYAPLHVLYPVYVLGYFLIMVGVIVFARLAKKVGSAKYAFFLAAVVLGNIGVWGVEQAIDVDFEFLSISYIATEMLLLLMSVLLREYDEKIRSFLDSCGGENTAATELPPNIEELFQDFSKRVATLTPSERMVLQYYIEGCSLEEVAVKAYISINTAKKHNTNLNRKLEVKSRDELILYIDLFRRANRLDEIAYMR